MRVPSLHPEVQKIVIGALTGGVETNIKELASLLEVDANGQLSAAIAVAKFVDDWQLEMAPSAFVGEYGTVRVLRRAQGSLDPAERVGSLLRGGESYTLEFKSSMLCSVQRWEAEGKLFEYPALAGELLKTICAFLNTDGGNLLVGVDDDGAVCRGIEFDFKLKSWDQDRWQQHLFALIDGRFHDSDQLWPYLRAQFLEIDSLPVFHISVLKRGTPSFVQRERGKAYEFFVRNGPRSQSLDLPAFYGHLRASSVL